MIDIKDHKGNVVLHLLNEEDANTAILDSVIAVPLNNGSVYHCELMTSDYIKLVFSLPEAISLRKGYYIQDANIGAITLNNHLGWFILSKDAKPQYNAKTGGYDYELEMVAWYYAWNRYILKLNPEFGAQEASFSLTTTMLDPSTGGHLGIIKKNIEHYFKGTLDQYDGLDIRFEVMYKTDGVNNLGLVENVAKAISYDNVRITDALSLIAQTYECEWWVEDNVIFFGRCDRSLRNKPRTELNIGEQMASLSRANSSGEYATRIYAFGSTRNVSARYRKSLILDVKETGSVKRNYPDDGTDEWRDRNYIIDTSRKIQPIWYDLACRVKASKSTLATLPGLLNISVESNRKRIETSSTESVCTISKGSVKFKPIVNVTAVNCNSVSVELVLDIYDTDNKNSGNLIQQVNIGPVVGVNEAKLDGEYAVTVSDTCYVFSTMYITVEGAADGCKVSCATPMMTVSEDNYYISTKLNVLDKDNNIVRTIPVIANPFFDLDYSDEAARLYLPYGESLAIGTRFTLDNVIKGKVPVECFTDDLKRDTTIIDLEKRLMLPLDKCPGNYVDSPEIIEDGKVVESEIVESVVVFEDVYPKKEVVVTDVSVDTQKVPNETDENPDGKRDKYLYRLLIDKDEFYFDSKYILSGGRLSVAFQSGKLAGMEFEVEFEGLVTSTNNNSYLITNNDNYGVELPNAGLFPSPGDKVVFFNYDVSLISDDNNSLVSSAENELYDKTVEYLKKSVIEGSTYTAVLMSDYAYGLNEGVQDKMYAKTFRLGDAVHLGHEGYFGVEGYNSRIIGVEIKIDIPYDSPSYTIGESSAYSRFSELEGKISQVKSSGITMSGTGNGGGSSVDIITSKSATKPTDNNVYSALASDERYLSRKKNDTAKGKITFENGIDFGQFVSGIVGGSGGRIDKDGNAELESLVLRSFLEVPELRFNRIDVVSGELWNSIAFGTIASVIVSNDGKGGTAWVHLEKTERCGLKVGDICRGIFSDFGDGKPKDENEDENGFQKTYGFSTAYFTPTAIIRNEEGEFGFNYKIQPGTKIHPCAYMKFAVYGSFTDPSRRASAYFTRSYMRYLKNVQTWQIDPDRNIASQFGNLDGLTIGGMQMKGEGTFLSNIFMTGAIIQFTPEQKEELKGQDAYSVVLSDYECVIHVNSDGNVRDMTKVRQVVATDGNVMAMKDGKPVSVVDLGYNATAAVQVHKGQTLMHHAPMVGELAYTVVPVFSNCEGFVANGVLIVTRIIDVEAGAYVDLEINCEGNAVFSKHYAISVVHDAADSFTQFVFKRTNDDEVAKPEGGSYSSPLPDGWSDGVPAGEAKLWMSRRKFTSDGKNQDADWSTPRPMTDTADFDVCFHDAVSGDAAPSAPPKDMHPTQTGMSGNNGWYDDGKTTSEWMAMATCSNGVWSDWSIVKIVGESPVIADIDNEMDGIGVGSDGILDVATSTSTNVCMYHGSRLMQIRSVSVSGLPSGVTASTAYPSSSDHSRCTVTFNISSGTNFSTTNRYAITITVVATYNGVDYTRTLTYTLLGTTNGKDGEVYYLQPSTTAVKRNKDLVYSPSTVTCARYIKKGTSDAVASTAGELTMSTDGGSTWDAYKSVSNFSGISSIIYRWRLNGVEVDRETVPVISDGIDGKSNVIADIDNEMDSIITDVDGNFSGSVALYANVSMWYGATKLTLDEITFSSVTGVTSSGNKSTGKCTFSVTSSMSDKAVVSITVKATHNGTQYVRTLTFTISKVKQGSKGENAIVYAIKTSVSAVKVDKSGNVSPSSVSASVTKTEGGSTQTLSPLISGMSLQSSKDGRSWSNDSLVNVSKSDTQVYFRLMLNGVEIDHETVPVVIDGIGIKNVTKFYALSTSDEKVTGTWGTELPTMTSIDRYLWCYEKITYTDGSTQITDPIIIGVYGEEGKPGLQGLIVRTGEWVSGAHYRCDEGVDCGFLDVVLIKNNSAETGWDAYKCIKEHYPSSSSNSPTSSSSSTYWQYMSNIGALFTSLIIAKNAKLIFVQTNQLLLENDNKEVTGGLSGGGGIQIWAGSDGMSGNTPNNPKFYVTSQGEMYAKSGVFEGSIKTKFTSGNDAVNFDKISGTANTIILPNGSGNVGREVTIYNSAFNQTRVPSETIIKVKESGNIMGAKVKGDNSFGSVSDQSQYANQIHFWGGIVKLIALPNTSTTCLWMVMFVNVEGGYYIYADSSGSWVYQKDINDASSVNGLRLASGTTAGDNDNTIYFVTE